MKALLVCMCAALSMQAAEKVVGGPFVIHAGPRTATVVYIVQSSEAAIGLTPERLERKAPALRAEKVSFTGLAPGQTYHYNATGEEQGKGSFRTPPVDGAPFEFVVYGDTRTRHEVHQRVVNAMIKHSSPHFVMHTGDLVADGADSAQWPIFFSIERELLRKVAFFPSLGNHERNNRQYYDFFGVTIPYYSFNWGKSHFVILNSDLGNAAQSVSAREAYWSEQVRWLEEDLAKAQQADFRFVIAHHPPFTAVGRRQGGNQHMAALTPMFEKYNVTAAFFGHDHNYQHHLKNNVRYVVTGGGGAPLYEVDKPLEGITQKVVSTEHFVTVQVAEGVARVKAVGVDGSILDSFELKKEDSAATAKPRP